MTATPPAGVVEDWKIAPSDFAFDVKLLFQSGLMYKSLERNQERRLPRAWRHLRPPPEEVRDPRIWPASLQLSVDVTNGTSGSPELWRRNLFQVSARNFFIEQREFPSKCPFALWYHHLLKRRIFLFNREYSTNIGLTVRLFFKHRARHPSSVTSNHHPCSNSVAPVKMVHLVKGSVCVGGVPPPADSVSMLSPKQ